MTATDDLTAEAMRGHLLTEWGRQCHEGMIDVDQLVDELLAIVREHRPGTPGYATLPPLTRDEATLLLHGLKRMAPAALEGYCVDGLEPEQVEPTARSLATAISEALP